MPIAPSSDGNTKLTLPSLGEVELRYVSGRDTTQAYPELLAETNDDKVLIQKVLFNQLIVPQMTFDEFASLPEGELQILARAFAKNENSIFPKIPTSSDDFYKELSSMLKDSQRKFTLQIRKVALGNITELHKTLEGITPKLEPILSESTMQSLASMTAFTVPKIPPIFSVPSPFQSVIAQTKIASSFLESLRPQLDGWLTWVGQNKNLFSGLGAGLDKVFSEYKIAQSESAELLRRYKWFVSPNTPAQIVFELREIDKKPGRQDAAVNKLFVGYFEANHWERVETMAVEWAQSPYFQSRHKIIMDTVKTLRVASRAKLNATNVVLPTLIVQIDGILDDYMRDKGLLQPTDGYGARNTAIKNAPLPILSNELRDLTNELFLDVLFRKSQDHGLSIPVPFNFNRHKILHAEKTHYGRKDYLVRAIMVLDALASLR